MNTQITSDWQNWIVENLARGCVPQSLVEVMAGKGFDPIFANAIVFHFSNISTQAKTALPAAAVPAGYVAERPRFPMQGSVIQTHDRAVRVTTRVSAPVVAVLDDILSLEECDELVRLSKSKLKRSTIVDPQTGAEEVIDDRSSFGTFFNANESELITRLDRRIAEAMHWPLENGEGLQILNYKMGGEYKPHFDYFPVGDPGSQVHLKNGGQRVSTMVIYLNDVEEGGETIFPELGMAISPKKGSAVYFEYCNSHSQTDPLTLHGGNPVLKGEKWIATKWMRQGRFG
ncbi:2OG-Fe(II) oxygenase [Iodobacter sp.]|uniref:2OG-Fe(II) oxygenase n=1 Tax=Iodobacter sp. TaxID=1915058 RepID=UPI0025D06C52|nr:2OG-Fe(II) oxygenase [Iodobacter sp.]